MSQWEDIVEFPEESEPETAEELFKDADDRKALIGEECHSHLVEATNVLPELDASDLLDQEFDHICSTANVSRAVEVEAEANMWPKGDSRFRVFPRKQ